MFSVTSEVLVLRNVIFFQVPLLGALLLEFYVEHNERYNITPYELTCCAHSALIFIQKIRILSNIFR